jgi:tetratricopeptide (TPR) repeat protein
MSRVLFACVVVLLVSCPVLAADPDAVVRGDEHFDKGQYDKAIAEYTEAIRLDPRDTQTLSKRAQAYMKMEDFDRALDDLNDILHLEPGNIAAKLAVNTVIARAREARAAQNVPQAAGEHWPVAGPLSGFFIDLWKNRDRLWQILGGNLLFLIVTAALLKFACATYNIPREGSTPAPDTTPPAQPRTVPVPSFSYALLIVFMAQVCAMVAIEVIVLPLNLLPTQGLFVIGWIAGLLFAFGVAFMMTPAVYARMLPTSLGHGVGLFFFQIKIVAVLAIVGSLIAVPIFLAVSPG